MARKKNTPDSIRRDFVWGEVIEVHVVGPYWIVEYYQRKVKGVEVTHEINYAERGFHPYVDGADTSHGYGSLEAAIVGAIAYKYEGINHHLDRYFIAALSHITKTGVEL